MSNLFKSDPKVRLHSDGYYHIRFYNPETRRRKEHTLGTKDKSIARRRARNMIVAFEMDEFDPFQDKFRFGGIRFYQAVDEFLQHKKGRVRDRTLTTYRRFLGTVKNQIPPDLLLRYYNDEDARQLIRQPTSPHSRANYYRHLNVFFNWCVENNLVDRNPLDEVEKPRPGRKTPAFLSKKEFMTLIAEIRGDYYSRQRNKSDKYDIIWLVDIFKFAVGTGCRRNEIIHLRRRDVDLENGFVYIKGWGSYLPKSSAERTIPLFPVAREAVKNRLNEHPVDNMDSLLFEAIGGGKLNGNFVNQRFREYREDAGLSDAYSFHTLRHTFASWLRIEGVPLDRIKEWMGHHSITQTEQYAHITPEHISQEGHEAFVLNT